MNGMRIKSHRPPFTKTTLPSPERFIRYTPLGAIRLLPPVSVANVAAATRVSSPAAAVKKVSKKTATGKRGARTRKKAAK